MGARWSEDALSNSHEKASKATASKAKTADQVKLPQNYEAIIKDADSPVNNSSIENLHKQLHIGVFLNQKRKKYWVDGKSNKNCFMLFARDLSIIWGEDKRYWIWSSLEETSDVFVDVAELLDVCWLEINGKLETQNLSPGTLYEVMFLVMLKDPNYGWEIPVNVKLIRPNGTTQLREENLLKKPRGQWIEIRAGEFRTSSKTTSGDIQFSLYEHERLHWKRGLVIKGVVIRPKH